MQKLLKKEYIIGFGVQDGSGTAARAGRDVSERWVGDSGEGLE